jgi:hypothetical protein
MVFGAANSGGDGAHHSMAGLVRVAVNGMPGEVVFLLPMRVLRA